MKKFLFGLSLMFICTFAIAHTINWHVGNQIISTTTCNSGDNITPPTAPSKRGYHLKEWLDSPYISLEYIQSTGTQYIDTGLTVGDKTEIQFVGSFTTVASPNGNVYQLFGVDDENSPRETIQIGISNTRKWFFSFGSANFAGADADTSEHTFVLKKESSTAVMDIDGNVAVNGSSADPFTSTSTI